MANTDEPTPVIEAPAAVYTPTLITLTLLQEKGACLKWCEIFAYRFPNGLFIGERNDLLKAINLGAMGPVISWAVDLGIVDKIDLRGADLRRADLGGADLGGADLGGAYLGGADLRRAYLGGADLGRAYLGGADLRGADLGGADLGRSALGGADLGGADLGGAYLGGADLRRAYLRGADLRRAESLTSSQLRSAATFDEALLAALTERERTNE